MFLVRGPKRIGGSFGSAIWRLGRTKLHLVVAWADPRCTCMYSNWLMIGISNGLPEQQGYDLWYKMYHDPIQCDSENGWFVRDVFKGEEYRGPVRLERSGLIAEGKMGTNQRTKVKVVLLPQLKENLAISAAEYINGEGEKD